MLSTVPIRPSVYPEWAQNSKNKKRKKNKIGIDVPRERKQSANFQLKGQSSRSLDIKTTQNWHRV